MLALIIPRVLWPAAEGIHQIGITGSVAISTVMGISVIRRRRRLRRRAGLS